MFIEGNNKANFGYATRWSIRFSCFIILLVISNSLSKNALIKVYISTITKIKQEVVLDKNNKCCIR